MRVAHLLRKYDPSEWGGTESAVKRLFDGLRQHQVSSCVYCPRIPDDQAADPFADAGYRVQRFRACVPVWGITPIQRKQLISVGGNLLSLDAVWSLWREPHLHLIHTHTHNRLGGAALTVAKLRKIPLVVTIHGGVLDLPTSTQGYLSEPLRGGVEWGKLFGMALRSRKVLAQADAILTCNRKEAGLLAKKYPCQRIVVQPHGVPSAPYQVDHRAEALGAFPQIHHKRLLLSVGRIDPVKNQGWLVDHLAEMVRRHPQAILVLAGSCTDPTYGRLIEDRVQALGLGNHVIFTGGLPPGDPRLIGLFQQAEIVLLPSLSETFGLVILEAWAAGTAVIASGTSGARELICEGENGWLFDLERPETFFKALDAALERPQITHQFAENGRAMVKECYDTGVIGGQIKRLYETLIEEKR